MLNKETVFIIIRNYIIEEASLDQEWTCSESENLFDLGVLRSFDIPSLIELLERKLNLDIDIEGLDMGDFMTLDNIFNSVSRKYQEC